MFHYLYYIGPCWLYGRRIPEEKYSISELPIVSVILSNPEKNQWLRYREFFVQIFVRFFVTIFVRAYCRGTVYLSVSVKQYCQLTVFWKFWRVKIYNINTLSCDPFMYKIYICLYTEKHILYPAGCMDKEFRTKNTLYLSLL